jgi:hypothetical protein
MNTPELPLVYQTLAWLVLFSMYAAPYFMVFIPAVVITFAIMGVRKRKSGI